MKTWKEHSGFVAWPTLLLAAVVAAGTVTIWTAALVGSLSWWLACPAMTGLIYLAFTPMHEASHGNIGGRRSLQRLDTTVGWACSLLFFAPYPTFKALHLRHHGTVNRVGRDPDLWVASPTIVGVVLRCLTLIPHYYVVFLGSMAAESPQLRRARNESVLGWVGLTLVALGWVASGHGWALVVLWLLPAWLASGLLAFAFDWLPHHPHSETERFTNARILDVPGITWLLLWQNYHLIHHLWPKVPFYRYRRVFDVERATLEAKGSHIVSR
jgi:fatty acid desaturase